MRETVVRTEVIEVLPEKTVTIVPPDGSGEIEVKGGSGTFALHYPKALAATDMVYYEGQTLRIHRLNVDLLIKPFEKGDESTGKRLSIDGNALYGQAVTTTHQLNPGEAVPVATPNITIIGAQEGVYLRFPDTIDPDMFQRVIKIVQGENVDIYTAVQATPWTESPLVEPAVI